MRWSLLALLVACPALRAELVCDQPVARFGTIKAGAPLGHRFVLTNKGTATIELVGFKTTCACFRPSLPKRVLLPGETTTLELQGNTLAQAAGPQAWRVRLAYRESGQERELSFEILAHLQVEVAVIPPLLTLTTTGPLSHELTLRDLRPTPLALTGVQTTSPGLQATFGEARRVAEGGWARTVIIRVGADYPVGRRDELLVLQSRDPDYPELRIPVTISKRGKTAFTASPAEVVLSLTPSEVPAAIRVQIAGAENTPVEIEHVEPLHPAITCTQAAATLKVRLDPARIPTTGLDSGVRVFLKGSPVPVQVPVRVEVKQP